MGFALWIDQDTALAQGTHEYRPMGVAVVAATDIFQPKDFHPRASTPSRRHESFVGLFASLQQLNRYLVDLRSQPNKKKFKLGSKRQLSIL